MTKLSKSQILKGTALPVAARSLEIFGEFFPASKNGAMRMKPVACFFPYAHESRQAFNAFVACLFTKKRSL